MVSFSIQLNYVCVKTKQILSLEIWDFLSLTSSESHDPSHVVSGRLLAI